MRFGIVVLLLLVCSPAFALGRRSRCASCTPATCGPAGCSAPAKPATQTTTAHSNATAQGVANWMAATGQVGHCGGNPGYEGCGMASTKEAAYAICCYSNMPWKTVDVGYAQRGNMWFCCRRYSTR